MALLDQMAPDVLSSTKTPLATREKLVDSFRAENDDIKEEFEESGRQVKTFNYYFLLLALLVIIIAMVFWFLHRRRLRRRQFCRQSGEQALERDVEGWANPRRFMHGRQRANDAVPLRQTADRCEGLDEHGEAPPPYHSKPEDTTLSVTIPLRTLPRDESERTQPPQYHDRNGRVVNTGGQETTRT
ncbi:hypothetical protein DDE82_006252 [Stemphylium lycopersici]|nr:hypothetical protein DDE82_006252 [Stemphylium lycopersici]